MAEPARRIDRSDTAPRFTADDVARLNARFEGASTQEVIRAVLTEGLLGRVAVVSSFGAESAVLLALAAEATPDFPVLFVNTGKLFGETLRYRDQLVKRLGLTDVREIGPTADEIHNQPPPPNPDGV